MKMLYDYNQRFAWRRGLLMGQGVEVDIAKKKLLRELSRTTLVSVIKKMLTL